MHACMCYVVYGVAAYLPIKPCSTTTVHNTQDMHRRIIYGSGCLGLLLARSLAHSGKSEEIDFFCSQKMCARPFVLLLYVRAALSKVAFKPEVKSPDLEDAQIQCLRMTLRFK